MHQSEAPGHDWESYGDALRDVPDPLQAAELHDSDSAPDVEADGGADPDVASSSSDDGDRPDRADGEVVDPPMPDSDSGAGDGADSAESDDSDSGPGCPECGCRDYFDPKPHGVSWRDVDDAGPGDDVRGCPRCSTGETWVVYGV